MKAYPLFYGTGALVAGNGFIAHVSIRGRCILEETSDEFVSLLGVNPGAVASDGATPSEANFELLERVRVNVFDIASESSDFEEFRDRVIAFVNETNVPNETIWKSAVAKVRAGELDLEGVPRQDADGAYGAQVGLVAVQVEGRATMEPSLNEPAMANEEFKVAVGF